MGVLIAIILIAVGLGAFGWFFMKDDAPAAAPQAGPATPPPGFASIGQQAAANPGVPVYDETYKVWTIEDPVHGKMWHQEATDTWVPF